MNISGYDIYEWMGFKVDEMALKYEHANRGSFKHAVEEVCPEFSSSAYNRLSMRDRTLIREMVFSKAKYMGSRDKKYILAKAKFGIDELPPPPSKKQSVSIRLETVYFEYVMQNLYSSKFSDNIRDVIREWIELKGQKEKFIEFRAEMLKKSRKKDI